MKLTRLNMLSLEDRRMMFDELILFKMVNSTIHTIPARKINLHNPIRSMRRVHTVYLLAICSYHRILNCFVLQSSICCIQRQHNELFQK